MQIFSYSRYHRIRPKISDQLQSVWSREIGNAFPVDTDRNCCKDAIKPSIRACYIELWKVEIQIQVAHPNRDSKDQIQTIIHSSCTVEIDICKAEGRAT